MRKALWSITGFTADMLRQPRLIRVSVRLTACDQSHCADKITSRPPKCSLKGVGRMVGYYKFTSGHALPFASFLPRVRTAQPIASNIFKTAIEDCMTAAAAKTLVLPRTCSAQPSAHVKKFKEDNPVLPARCSRWRNSRHRQQSVLADLYYSDQHTILAYIYQYACCDIIVS